MKTIHIIDKLVLEQDTLCVKGANGRLQPVHLRQGDMDGACAVYSLMMAMLTCGIINRKDAEGLYQKIDGRSSLGRLLNRLTRDEGLIRDGLYLSDIYEVINHNSRKIMGCNYSSDTNNLEDIRQTLENDKPVIVAATFKGNKGAHAMLIIGYESDGDCITRLFCLDPGYQMPDCSYWNAIIHINCNSAKEYKHTYMPNATDVKITETITIFKK